TLRGMQPKAVIAFLACLCLAFRAEAFLNFGDTIRTTVNAIEGVGNLIHGIFGRFTAEELGFEEDVDFKPRLLSVNALCMMDSREGHLEAEESCKSFVASFAKDFNCQKLSSVVKNG
ncbi:hypothetical protein CPB97_004993, partial [Podila verticillata]